MRTFWFFDLDGTLADTDPDIRVAWKAALADLGLSCPDFDARFVAGPPLEESFRSLFPDRYTPALAAELRRLFGKRYDDGGFACTREYPGILDGVRRLKDAGARVFIVTNKRHAGATAMARAFGWDRVFEGVYSGDMYRDTPVGTMRKPALLRFVMEKTGAAPGDSVMVGDTRNDFEAAAANGVWSIAVPWGYGTPEERALADARVASGETDLARGLLAASPPPCAERGKCCIMGAS
jgi:phosphoglycolate phosphatase